MVETDIRQTRMRGWVAGVVALACIQAWMSGTAHAYCVNAFSTFFSTIELEIIVPMIGLCVAACIGLTVAIGTMRLLQWPLVMLFIAAYVVGASVLLSTLSTVNPSREWMILPVLGSAAGAVVIGLTVRRMPALSASAIGLLAAAACFVITYAMTPFTGSGGCGFAP